MALHILSPLHRATRQISIHLESLVKGNGLELSADEGHALTYIATYGPCPTGEVQRVLGRQRSTMTSMLHRLEQRKLLRRRTESNDARVVLLETTAAGNKMAHKAEAIAKALEEQIQQQLSSKDLAALQRIVMAVEKATGVTVVERTISR